MEAGGPPQARSLGASEAPAGHRGRAPLGSRGSGSKLYLRF